jgi:branched-chain amino acid transport system substrate-binding protein
VLSACAGSSDDSSSGDDGPIKIGIIAPQTGSIKIIGDQLIHALQAARVAYGDINGRKVEYVIEDAGNFEQDKAAAQIQKLVQQDHVVAVLGLTAGECLGGLSVADRVQVPMIGSNCVVQQPVAEDCNKWFIGLSPAPSMIAKAMAPSAERQFPDLIGKPWIVLGDDPGWSQAMSDAWTTVPGSNVVSTEIAPFGTTDWAPYIQKLEASHAGAVLLSVSWGDQYVAFLQQANAAGLFEKMSVVAPVGFPEWMLLDPKTAAAAQKLEILTQWGGSWDYENQQPARKAYNEAFYKLYNTAPTTQGNWSMATAYMLFDAIAKVGTDNEKLIDELTTDKFDTPLWEKPIFVQPGGRQVEVPMFAGKVATLPQPKYGVTSYVKTLFTIPPEVTLDSASDLGCNLSS